MLSIANYNLMEVWTVDIKHEQIDAYLATDRYSDKILVYELSDCRFNRRPES